MKKQFVEIANDTVRKSSGCVLARIVLKLGKENTKQTNN